MGSWHMAAKWVSGLESRYLPGKKNSFIENLTQAVVKFQFEQFILDSQLEKTRTIKALQSKKALSCLEVVL